MSDAFAAAAAALADDPNLGTDAVHFQAGSAIGQAVRVIVSRRDVVQELGAVGAVVGDVMIDVEKAELAEPAVDDVIEIGSESFRVMAVAEDARGVKWRLPCRRAEAATLGSVAIGNGI